MVLAREVWNCVHKLNYFNLRERESERIMESGCVSVCVAFTCETHAGVLMESEKDGLIFILQQGSHLQGGI